MFGVSTTCSICPTCVVAEHPRAVGHGDLSVGVEDGIGVQWSDYLQSLSEVISPSNKVVLESYHEMNAYGQVTEERYRNGITTMRTCDSRSGRLTDIDTRKGTAVFQNNTYAWKTNGSCSAGRTTGTPPT